MLRPRGRRDRLEGWRWWQVAAFLLGCVAIIAALLSPLERLGRRDLLAAHVAQHVVLGDAAAPLLLLGLPPRVRRWLRERLSHLTDSSRRSTRLLGWVLSPPGALVAWALAVYTWCLPPVHRLAVKGGPIHVADHLSFLAFGMVVWLVVFDPREPQTLRSALRRGGLPWWGRHLYAIGSRMAMVPAAAVIWLAPGYHAASRLPLGYSRSRDQIDAASLMIGFEMLLFAFGFVAAFIFLAVAEGKRQSDAGP